MISKSAHETDVVVVGAGGAGIPAALAARAEGAEVICIDENHDVGGHAILSGGRVILGGGTSIQRQYGIEDSADAVYQDHTNEALLASRYGQALYHADRELVRAWADECAPTFEFLVEHGVAFEDGPPVPDDVYLPGLTPRLQLASVFSDDLRETIAGRPGSGIVRSLERSARQRGVVFLLRHRLRELVRADDDGRRVLGVRASHGNCAVSIYARRGVVLATGGHTSNVEFRRMFDPRLTEEYQVVGEPWSRQTADGEMLAMELGAALWSTASQARGALLSVCKTAHIGCRWGYVNLKWPPDSPVFASAEASGLTVDDWQDVILVDVQGRRFWNEADSSEEFLRACLTSRGGGVNNGGGPIWAIFDRAAVSREGWDPSPPHVREGIWFHQAGSLEELAVRIDNPFQRNPIPPDTLRATVERYNSFVDAGRDLDFGKPNPQHRIEDPPYYAAWATPILHDTLTGLRIDAQCRVIDVRGKSIAGLYAAGETAGGFGYHGLPRALVFGRIAGREAARSFHRDR